MPQGFPCPNPACQHVFAPEAVQGAKALLCPRCGSRFQFRSTPREKPPPPALPVARVIPEKSRGTKAPPLPSPAPAEDDPSLVPPVLQPMVRIRRDRPTSRTPWKFLTVFLVLFLLVGAGVVAALRNFPGFLPRGVTLLVDEGTVFKNLNCRYRMPDKPWDTHPRALPKGMAPALSLRRPEPEANLALFARDYKDYTPRNHELREEGVRRLAALFPDNLDWEQGDACKLGGRPGLRVVFRGQSNGATYAGECRMLAHHGMAYWLAAWAPDDAPGEFDDLYERFALHNEREAWQEARAVTRSYAGTRVKYRFTDLDLGLWKEGRPATDFDPEADLVLYAGERDPAKSGGLPVMAAKLLVLVLPPAADADKAVTAARAHVVEQAKALNLPVQVESLGKPEADADVGNARGRWLRLKLQIGETQQRFALLGVVHRPKEVLVLLGECGWKQRDLWEPDFLQAVKQWKLE